MSVITTIPGEDVSTFSLTRSFSKRLISTRCSGGVFSGALVILAVS